jgi:hypothetical protein
MVGLHEQYKNWYYDVDNDPNIPLKENTYYSELQPLFYFVDRLGQCMLVSKKEGLYSGAIHLQDGKILDASSLLRGFSGQKIRRITSSNFLKKLYISTCSGLRIVSVRVQDEIEAVPIPSSLRALIQLNDDTILVNTQGGAQYYYSINTRQYKRNAWTI